MKKLIRITTVPISLGNLLEGQSKFMSQYFEVVGISSGEPLLSEVGKKEGIRVIPVEMTRKITPFKDLKALWQLYWLFRKERPFIVHSHTPKAGTLGMMAAWLARVPHRLHTIAGLPLVEIKGPKRFVLNIVERITYSCATRVYPNSTGLKQIALENRFAPEKKLKVIGNGSSNGIDTDYFDPDLFSEKENSLLRQSLEIPEDDFVFIFVGRLVKDKGIHELISAFRQVAATHENVKLLLVGTYEPELDPIEPETEAFIRNSPLVKAVGWRKDVRPFFAIADCLVFPSYREGFPNVVMQAGAMGLFSIVTDINGCNEIVEDGVNGRIVPPKDDGALCLAMKECRNAPLGYKEHRMLFRKMIRDRYDRGYIWNELLKEYKSLEAPDV